MGRRNKELAEKLKEYSRMKYGQERQAIEDDIFKRCGPRGDW